MYKRLTLKAQILLFFAGALFISIGFVPGMQILHEERLWMQLNAVGQKTSGQLLDSYRSNGRWMSYYVVYQYTFPNQQSVKEIAQKDEKIPKDLYYQLVSKRKGTVVPLVYLPNNPESIRFMRNRAIFQVDSIRVFSALLILLVIGSAFIARLFIDLLGDSFIHILFGDISQAVLMISVIIMILMFTIMWFLAGIPG